jgi:hypothetical protein
MLRIMVQAFKDPPLFSSTVSTALAILKKIEIQVLLVLWIRIGFNAHPDSAFQPNVHPESSFVAQCRPGTKDPNQCKSMQIQIVIPVRL